MTGSASLADGYRLRWLAVAGGVALLVSLVMLVPARVAIGWLGLPPGMASGVTGTAWHGEIRHLALGSGRLILGPVRWQLKPSSLLLARLAAEVRAELPDGFVAADISLSAGGKLTLRNLEAAAPLTWLAPGVADPGSQLSARFDRLVLAKGWIATAVGSLQLAGVILPIPAGNARLDPGSYTLGFDAHDVLAGQPVEGQLKDAGGPLELSGTVKFSPPRSYELQGRAKARPNAPPEVGNALTMLGPALPDGTHQVSLAGSF